jgi:vanillate monooxygenase ferredoxin subunit
VAEQGHLPAFTAGAHLDVHLPNGLVRQYSLCNPPADRDRYLIAVLRDAASRGGSQAVHEAVAEGSTLQISAPKNHFPLSEAAQHHLLMAGGIGITPMLAMAETLSASGQSFELHYATRSRERTAFIDRIAAAPYASRVTHHLDDGEAAQKLHIATTLGNAPKDAHLYVCGPQGFMDAVLGAARSSGWSEDRLHYEFFGAAPVDTSGDGSFEVEIASSGRIIPVLPEQTTLQALQAAGLDIPMSCEQGVCGTCLTGVKSGTPDHRDHYLTPEEQAANDQFLPCCSRAKSARLVLDL